MRPRVDGISRCRRSSTASRLDAFAPFPVSGRKSAAALPEPVETVWVPKTRIRRFRVVVG
jgi:hypothetical protein